jgi:hypothetical protein
MSSLRVESFGTRSDFSPQVEQNSINLNNLPNAIPGCVLSVNSVTNMLEWEENSKIMSVDIIIAPLSGFPSILVGSWLYGGSLQVGNITKVQFVLEYLNSSIPLPQSGITARVWNRSLTPPNSLISPVVSFTITNTKDVYEVPINQSDLPTTSSVLELHIDNDNANGAIVKATAVSIVFG